MAISLNGGTGEITGVSVGGLPDGVVDSDVLADSAVTAAKVGYKGFASYAIICDEKSAGTDGGTFTSGAWQDRDLNTELIDTDGIVTISSNQFTLTSAGTYFIEFQAPAVRVNGHMARLYDVTGNAQVALGCSTFSDSGADGDTNYSFGFARVTISSANTYKIQHQCTLTEATIGFGRAFSIDVERYTFVKIQKEA